MIEVRELDWTSDGFSFQNPLLVCLVLSFLHPPTTHGRPRSYFARGLCQEGGGNGVTVRQEARGSGGSFV